MVTQKVSYLKVIKISLQCQAKSFLLLIFQVFIQIGSRRKVIFALQYSGITHKGVLVTLVSKGQNWQYLRNYPNLSVILHSITDYSTISHSGIAL